MPWIKKYQPKKISDIVGQNLAVEKILSFINNFKKSKRKALLLYGPTGNGKTSSIYAIANELGLEVVEVNASDIRNKENINSIVGAATKQMSLFFKSKIILVDEVDGIAGRADYGGLSALASLIQDTSFPMIFTANDPFDQKFSDLRKKVEMVEFPILGYADIFEVLQKICLAEKIKHNPDDLKTIARRAGGDLRSAINDLQTIVNDGDELVKSAVDELSQRDRSESVPNALLKVFKSTDPGLAVSAFNSVDLEPEKLMLWVDENLPKEYTKKEDLARAYEMLSRADVFFGRISRRQDWRYLVYYNSLMTSGVAVSKDEKYKSVIEYKPTSRILKIWISNQKYLKRKSIALKIAESCHISYKRALTDSLPYLKVIFKKDDDAASRIADQLELNEEEIDWMKN